MPQPIKEEDLKNITKKVYALYAKHGFDGISMDEVCAQTNISKATLYRYFTSKEDIVRSMVDVLISHLNTLQFDAIDGIGNVLDGFQKVYIKSTIIAALTGSEFLTALEKKLPDTYETYHTAFLAMQERSAAFFRQTVEKGYCRQMPFPLVSKQFQNMLPLVINMDFLERNQMTLTEALKDYYRMFLYQILRPEYQGMADAEETYDFVGELADALQSDCYIDSIRR